MATGRIGVTPTLRTRWSKAPAGGTTSLSGLDDNSVSLVYDVGYEGVYRNGVLLSRGNDYTATDGTTVTLIDATIAGDIIEIFANELIPLSDAISKGQFTAKGALLSATAASTPGVLTVGTNDQVLTADSSTATGLKWAAASSGGMTLLASGSLAASGIGFDLTSISGAYNELWLYVNNWSTTYGSIHSMSGRINNDTTSSYNCTLLSNTPTLSKRQNDTWQYLSDNDDVDSVGRSFVIRYPSYANTTSYKLYQWQIMFNPTISFVGWGIWENTGAINRLRFDTNGVGSFDSGTYELYGVK